MGIGKEVRILRGHGGIIVKGCLYQKLALEGIMKRTAFFVTVGLIAAIGMFLPVSAAELVSSGPIAPAAAAAAEAYWTVERIQSAIPHPMGIPGYPTDVTAAQLEASATSPAVSATSSKTGRPSHLLTPAATPRLSGIQPASSTYPFPHTTYKVLRSSYTVFPYRAVGKVFFTNASGVNYVCSGSSVGGRAVFTAGHCVAEGGQGVFHRNWSFIPAFRGWQTTGTLKRPYGRWTAAELWTTSGYLNNGTICRDVGAAVTNYNAEGLTLSQVVGNLGFSYNATRYRQHWDAIAYPASSPWDGKEMVQSEAEWARDDNPGCTPYTVAIGTSQRPGCSGGPLIGVFYPNQAGATNYINGIFSYYYTNQPNGMYSPYFDTTIFNLWDTVRQR